MDEYKEVGARIFWELCYERTRRNRHKLQCLNIKTYFFVKSGMKHKEMTEKVCRISALGDIRNLTGQGNILELDLLW